MFRNVLLRLFGFHGLGFALGLASGVIVGVMSGALFLGALIGTAVGYAAGRVMQREDEKHAERTRHLDDLIGVTSGSLGTSPESLRPPRPMPTRSILEDLTEDVDADGQCWLTPPPPALGG